MLLALLLLQVAVPVNSTAPIMLKPGESVSLKVTNSRTIMEVSKPYICKNGKRPELPRAIISRCRAEFLGLPSDTEWYNPYPGVIERYQGHCSNSTQWDKKRGGDNRYYSDDDWVNNIRPKRGAKPCYTQ